MLRTSCLTLTLALTMAACAGDDAPILDGFIIDGSAVSTGGAVPTAGHVAGLWIVSSSSPDYLYKFGDGTSQGANLSFALPTEPPPAALNTFAGASFGVSTVGLYEAGWSAPDGEITEAEATAGLLGLSGEYAIIWKGADPNGVFTDSGSWLTAFPDGYSCGRCVHAADGFDSWAPVDCAELEIAVPDNLDNLAFCDWT